jgi:antitoxin component YwqK of YwqJK toxin-antitoxin module
MKYILVCLLFSITSFVAYGQKAEWIDFTKNGDVNFKIIFYFFKDSTIIYTLDENDSVRSTEKDISKKYFENKIKDSIGLIYSSNKDSINKNEFNGLLKLYSKNNVSPYVVYKFKYGFDKIIQEDYPHDNFGIFNGENVLYFKSGKTFIIQNYSSGKLHGEFLEYFESGNLKRKGYYLNGDLNGEWLNYNENGTLRSKLSYIKANKIETFYSNGSEYFYFECCMDGYSYNGVQKLYYENGQLEDVSNFKNGKMINRILYHQNGKVRRQETFNNGKYSGVNKEFFENGNLEAVRNYNANGELNGIVKVFFENGKKYLEGNYSNGLQNGIQLSFYENGQIRSSYNYLKGKKEGLVKTYDSLGNPIFYEFYKNDKLEGLRKFYQNGKLLLVGNYRDGKKSGSEITYNDFNQIIRARSYKDGLANGESKDFYNNGKLEKSGFYLNNNVHGQWMFYNILGRLTEIQVWNNGQKISTKIFR